MLKFKKNVTHLIILFNFVSQFAFLNLNVTAQENNYDSGIAEFDVTHNADVQKDLLENFELNQVMSRIIYSAYVTRRNGNTNDLTINVTRYFLDDSSQVFTETFPISNNDSGTFEVGGFQVFVRTQANTQIREINLLDFYEDSIILFFPHDIDEIPANGDYSIYKSHDNSNMQRAAIRRTHLATTRNQLTPWRVTAGETCGWRLNNRNAQIFINKSGGSNVSVSVGVSVRLPSSPISASVSVSGRTGSSGLSSGGVGIPVNGLVNQWTLAQVRNLFDVRTYEIYYSSRPGQTRQLSHVPVVHGTEARLIRANSVRSQCP